MQAAQVKQKVREFRREYGLREVTLENLENAFERQGFTIIPFNPVLNDPDVETVINSFCLQEMIRHSNGFMYLDQEHRLVFLKENLSDMEKRIVLAHEEGHYYCGHASHAEIAGRCVTEEFEANEFAHYLLTKTLPQRFRDVVLAHRKLLLFFLLIVLLTASGAAAVKQARDRRLYEGEYYVSEHGTKYHRKDCVTIEGHEIRRLTKEDIKSGQYEPCSVCSPDQ